MRFANWLLFESSIDDTVLPELQNPHGGYLAYLHGKWTAKYSRSEFPDIEFSIIKSRKYIDVEFSSIHNPKLKPALQELLKVAPWLLSYDMTFDGHRVKVTDVLDQKEDPDWIVKYWYHGTSGYYAEIALREGLKPRVMTNLPASFVGGAKEGNPNLIYLSANDGNAVRFAAREANRKVIKEHPDSKPTILRIDATKLLSGQYFADEDSGKSTWKDSLYAAGSVGYRGIIRPEAINVHMVWKDGNWHDL